MCAQIRAYVYFTHGMVTSFGCFCFSTSASLDCRSQTLRYQPHAALNREKPWPSPASLSKTDIIDSGDQGEGHEQVSTKTESCAGYLR